MIEKTCPIVLHPDGTPLRHLMFHHPKAGQQLVKGTVKPNEDPRRAAMRELFEESGLETQSVLTLGHSDDIADGERWHFALCRPKAPLRETWQHFCADDGGHLFLFHWHALDTPITTLHPTFHKARSSIKNALT